MKKHSYDFCNYLGALLGFIGALLMTFAVGEIKSATYYDEKCTGPSIGKSPEALLNAMKECERHIVGLEHPLLNRLGLALLGIGFLIQFYPAFHLIKKWVIQKVQS